VLESGLLRGVFGPKMVEVRGEWEKLHSVDSVTWCPYQGEWDGRSMWHVRVEERCIQVFVGKPEGKRLF
jgi:hypothetical protein